jgi:uncharacterized protein (DUF58 family)
VRRQARVPVRAQPVVGWLVRYYEDQLTPRGRYLLAVTAAFALVGLDTRRSRLHVLFAVAFAAYVVAWTLTRLRAPRASLDCALPVRATAGTPLALRLRVSSPSGGSYGPTRVRFPRPTRWGGSIRYSPSDVFLPPAREPAERTVEFLALRRGRYELEGPWLSVTDPLQLAASWPHRMDDQRLLVYPRFFTLTDFMVPVGRRYQPGGIPLSSNTGDTIEFVGTRDYREGDPVRNIHWRSWARRGEPVVKEHQEEYFSRIAIVLDSFVPARAGAAATAAFEAAISVVASIADHFSRSEYVVDILAAGPDIYEVSAGRSLAYLENILDVLACLEPCPDPPFAGVGPPLFEKLQQITTVVAVLQDWDDAREAFLRRIHALGTAVRAVVVHDGPTARPWHAAAGELGEISQLASLDVERLLGAEAGRV